MEKGLFFLSHTMHGFTRPRRQLFKYYFLLLSYYKEELFLHAVGATTKGKTECCDNSTFYVNFCLWKFPVMLESATVRIDLWGNLSLGCLVGLSHQWTNCSDTSVESCGRLILSPILFGSIRKKDKHFYCSFPGGGGGVNEIYSRFFS
jgi:hypothetical protein